MRDAFRWAQRAMILGVLAGAVLACGGARRHVLSAAAPVGGNQVARQRFLEARTAFLNGHGEIASFTSIISDFPEDPVALWAQLYKGISELRAGEYAPANASLLAAMGAGAPPELTLRATLYRGIVASRAGDHATANTLLGPHQAALLPDGEDQETRDLRAEYWAAVGQAATGSSADQALKAWDEYWRFGNPVERLWATTAQRALLAGLSVDSLRDYLAARGEQELPSVALVGTQLCIHATQAHSGFSCDEAQALAKRLGLTVAAPADASLPFVPGRVLVLLPAGAKAERVATTLTQALLAVPLPSGVQVETLATDDMGVVLAHVKARPPIAVIGPTDGSVSDAAMTLTALGLPVISLAIRPEERVTQGLMYYVAMSAEMRGRWLARHALQAGLTRVAIMAPQSGYGRAVRSAFVEAFEHAGGKLVGTTEYPADTKSFAPIVAKLTGDWQGLFVAEQADRLELLVPALAAAGFVMGSPASTLAKPGPKRMVLLSTAEGLQPKFVANVGRHCPGALFAPGYVALDDSVFAMAFAALHQRVPTALEAYLADAVRLVLEANVASRGQLADALRQVAWQGETGLVRFDASLRRADAGVLYTIEPGARPTLRTVK